MPIFGSPHPDIHHTTATSPRRKGSLFSTNRSHSSSHSSINHSTSPTRKGFFGRRSSSSDHPRTTANRTGLLGRRSPSPDHRTGVFGRRSSSSDNNSGSRSTRGGKFFGGSDDPHNDPTILAARQKVTDAEKAEKDADRALSQARAMVSEARNQVKILEKEAVEDARRAKAKQAQAKMVSKSARSLGRHGK